MIPDSGPIRCRLEVPVRIALCLTWSLLILICGLAGCMNQPGQSARGETAVAMDTLGGIVVVRNGLSGLWGEAGGWTLEEEFRLGGANGPPEVLFGGNLTSVSMGPQGQLYVLDPQADEISVFDGEGRFLRRFGGPGPGPGQLSSPLAMGWDGLQRLWVAEGFNGRYTVFDSTGTLIKTVPRQMRSAARWQHRLVFDGFGGSFVDEGAAGEAVTLLRVDTTGSVVDTFPQLRKPARPSFFLPSGFDREVLQYLPNLVWTVAPDATIWFAESGELRLFQRTLEGDTIRIVETQHRKASLDSRTERVIEREFSKAGLDESDYSVVRPLVQTIHVLDDGHILVQIIEEVGQDGRVFDVFDPDGRFLGSMPMGFRMTGRGIPALVGDTVLAVALGRFEVPYVVRATIRRSGC